MYCKRQNLNKLRMAWVLTLLLLGVAAHTAANEDLLAKLYHNRQSNVQVAGSGEVVRLLPQDNIGSRHQKFIVKLASGQTLMIAHNIDLAPKIPTLQLGDTVSFYGEYEWNDKGGVVHWTHKDPANRHTHGWLQHRGITYQ